ncbi:cobyric acid synthase [Propionispora vibrioides]|jgi:adenosylcobyric acid synthase|uniref:Cobyric acid synthase n=1 Tax=Propionispora vibrioides TaxID=112903 RepID=A0A1H8P7M7_9FIRM|nr:cobyric acid synthase [Propionispora vibrioides]SEO37902.1 adenosylcobyric acid synthase (glutamine-hydrolysing) [Propionispora vibrioides]
MAKPVMIQGTSSHVGKSILTTALCRIFLQDGFQVVPFKAQNMALNSYVTKTGEEMGRAQVAQAEAAGLEPMVEMNPVLLKPTGNAKSQVILKGSPVGNMSAAEYHNGYSLKALHVVEECLKKLDREYEIMVIEGAGSPAEVNLKANDIVNMRIAKLLQAPVLLVADIDRGGALAAVVGTLELLEPEERELVKGIIINKFRGDIRLLQPALEFLEQKTGKPVLGVIPHLERLGIDDEDSVSLDEKKTASQRDLEIAVIRTPKISNFTDFDVLAGESDVAIRYVKRGEAIGQPDLIILPGSKNTLEDLLYLKEMGYDRELERLLAAGTPVIGICGGYQMLGKEILDPEHTESELESAAGLGLLDTVTTFAADKVTHQVSATCNGAGFLGIDAAGLPVTGYEIHMGRTEFGETVQSAFSIHRRSEQEVACQDGVVRRDGLVMGTYIHGIFDNDQYRRAILNALRERKGLARLDSMSNSRAEKQASYNRLADTVRTHLDMAALYRIMGLRG